MEKVVDKLRSTFSGRKVLILGDTGFKGSWLSLLLMELGAKVNGYALPPEHADGHYCQLGLGGLIQHKDGDIRDFASLKSYFDECQPEFLFHLAAQPLVSRSYADPKSTFDTNVGGSVNVLESVRACESLRAVIYVTSDKCYKNKEWVWGYRENDELGGRDPYSSSKAAAELVFSAYVDSFFARNNEIGLASVRAGNVIGGGDWADSRIIPDCIRALRSGKEIILRSPNSTRPWQHVLDPLLGYLQLAVALFEAQDKFGGSWNFGPESVDIRTVRNLVDAVVHNWGRGDVLVDKDSGQFHEANLLHLNCDRSRFALGWKPRWDFDKTVYETTRWYKSISEGDSAVEVSTKQIRSYLGLQ